MAISVKKAAINLRDAIARIYKPKYAELPITKWFSQLGNNGTFDSGTGWTKGTGWAISGNTASSDGSQTGDSDLEQTLTLTAGKTYKAKYKMLNRSAGSTLLFLDQGGLSADAGAQTNDGEYSVIFTAIISAHRIAIRANSNFIGDVDSVSIREVMEFDSSDNITAVHDSGLLLNPDEYTITDNGTTQTLTIDVEPSELADVAVTYWSEI